MSSETRILGRLLALGRGCCSRRPVRLIIVVLAGWACATSQAGPRAPEGGQTVTWVSSPAVDVRITSELRVSRRVINAPMSDAWTALAAAYEQLEIPVSASDRMRWLIGNARVQTRRIGNERMSRYFECGQASMGRPRADEYDVTYSIFSRLQQEEDGRTVLLTEVDGSARPSSVSTNPLHCSSKGTLEELIADLVAEWLETRPDNAGQTEYR